MKKLRSWLVAASAASLLASGLAASAADAPKASGRAGRPATPKPLLGGEGRKHVESPDEIMARAIRFNTIHAGGLSTDAAAEARLAAFGAAQRMPAAFDGALTNEWHEAGPLPYHVEDPRYGHGCSLDCLQPAAFEQPLSDLGWDVVAGRVTALAVDPGDDTGNKVWVGAAGGGVWYSTDGGTHWTPKFDDQPSLSIGAIAIDPKNPSTVFVGTGEANNAFENIAGTGVYRTRDNGTTWERVASNVRNASVISRIEIAAGRIFVATNKGLFRSTDGGNSYHDVRLPTNAGGTAVDPGPFASVVTDVRIHPDRANEITAAVGWRRGKKGCAEPRKPDCAPGNGLYRSTNGGAPGSWTRLTAEGFGTPGRSHDPLGRIVFAYATGPGQNHDVMWALIQDAGRLAGDTYVDAVSGVPNVNPFNGVYRSEDDGATWELKATSETLNASPGSGLATGVAALYFPGVQSWYNVWIGVDPKNADNVLLGLEEIYQTTANANAPGLAAFKTVGRYWNYCLLLAAGPEMPTCDKLPGVYAGRKTTHPDQHAYAFALTKNGVRLYAGNDGGAYRQDSDGNGFSNDAWTSLNDTLGSTQPYYAVMSGDGTIYAGFQDNGTAKIQPNGRADMVFGGDGFDVAVDPQNSDIAFEEYVGGTMYKTLDGGERWIPIAPLLTGAMFSQAFEMDPKNPSHLVLPAREIAESTKGADTKCDGDQLSQMNAHVEDLCDWVFSYDVGSFEYGAEDTADWQSSAVTVNGADVYVGLCVTCDILTTAAASGDPSRFHNAIATNVKPGCTPATGTDSCWHVIADPKGLPRRYVADVAYDPVDPNTVYAALSGYSRRWYTPSSAAAGRGHVFVSHDGGATFKDLSTNLPDVPANALLVRGDRLYVGTDVGVFTAPKSGGVWTRLGTGLPNAAVFDVNLNPQGTKMVVATHGRGVWVYDFGSLTRAPRKPGGGTSVLGKKTTKPGALPATGAEDAAALASALLAVAIAATLRLRARRNA